MSAPPPPRPGEGWEAIDQRIAPAAAGPDAPPEPLHCTVCGTPLSPDQTYCLECGAPTPLAPRLARRAKGTLLVAGALVLAGIGTGALAYAVSDDEPTAAVTSTTTTAATVRVVPPATTSTTTLVPVVPVVPSEPGVGPLPPDTSGAPPTTTGGQFPTVTSGENGQVPDLPPTTTGAVPGGGTTDPGPDFGDEGFDEDGLGPGLVPGLPGFDPDEVDPLVPGGGGDEPGFDDPGFDEPGFDDPGFDDPGGGSSMASDWPLGRDAWTVQVSSVRDRGAAEAIEARLRSAGEPAGVLVSGEHPELVPGFFVVFSGVYDSRAAAVSAAGSVPLGFPGAFARMISS